MLATAVLQLVETDKAAVPSEVLPSRKVSEPVGVPVAGLTGLTLAVSDTGCPKPDGSGEETSDVRVLPDGASRSSNCSITNRYRFHLEAARTFFRLERRKK